MKTGNFPRCVIEGVGGYEFPYAVSKDDWLISITNSNGDDAKVEAPFDRVLFLQFNDTDKIGKGEIHNDQAKQIADFIKEGREHQKNIWVNCHAGICRSGAVVSLLIDLGWENAESHLSPGRIPNHLVYDKVRKHFPEVSQSWDKPGLILPESDIWVAAKGW